MTNRLCLSRGNRFQRAAKSRSEKFFFRKKRNYPFSQRNRTWFLVFFLPFWCHVSLLMCRMLTCHYTCHVVGDVYGCNYALIVKIPELLTSKHGVHPSFLFYGSSILRRNVYIFWSTNLRLK